MLIQISNFKFQVLNDQRGFTLIELIVAIGVLSLLSIFIISTLNPFEQFKKAADARRKSDLSQIANALEAYYQDNGRYPLTTGEAIVSPCSSKYCIQTQESSENVKAWGESWAPYMQVLPKDTGGRSYIYYVDNNEGQSYWLYASLERGAKDPQVCNSGNSCLNVPPDSQAPTPCGSNAAFKCNYGISSSNVSP